MGIKHQFVSTEPDDPDASLIRPSNWNEAHTIEDGTITAAHVNAANKDGLANVPSLRTLGTGATQAAAGNHAHDGTYAAAGHNHDGSYSAIGHNHAGAYATPADVAAAVSALVDSSPAALDTLNELAAALGDDPNFAASVTTALGGKQPLAAILTALSAFDATAGIVRVTGAGTVARLTDTAAGRALLEAADAAAQRGQLGLGTAATTNASDYAAAAHAHAQADVTGLVDDLALKAPLASPTFTGVPAAPTAAPGTNTTQLATTAFVIANAGGISDSDKGDITVSGGGTVWTIDADVLTPAARSVLDDASVSAMVDTLGGAAATGAGGLVRTTAPTLTSPILPAASPSAPSAGNVTVHGADLAGRVVPGFRGASGAAMPLAAHRGMAHRMEVSALNNATTLSAYGGTFTNAGTLTARTITAGTYFGWQRRVSLVSAAAAGSQADLYTARLSHGLGDVAGCGGFTYVCQFGIADASAVANARMFVGFTGSTSPPGNVEPSSLTNIIGVGCDAGVTTLHIMHNDGSGTATAVDLGANFPTNTQSTDVYELAMYAAPNGSTVGYRVRRLNTGDVASGTISTDLPAGATLLNPHVWRNNGATALAVDLAFISLIVETER